MSVSYQRPVEPGPGIADGVTTPTASVTARRARAGLAVWSAVLAFVALVVGGVAMSVTALPGRSIEAVLDAVRTRPALYAVAAVALAAVSLADLGTIAALHDRLQRRGPRLVLLAAGTAIVGDLLNIAGRLAQLALVPIATSGRTDLAPAAAVAADLLDATFNTAGFVLVSVAFAAFGVLFVRDGRRYLGAVALVAAVGTAAGQLPPLAPAFYVANAAFLLWYAALVRLFDRDRDGVASPTVAEPGAGGAAAGR